jgi:predicted MFS family arabinose efflux permease
MRKTSINLTIIEKQATFSLAAIFAFRMLGLFMIIPVFSLYAHQLQGTTPFLVGIAMGCYGLTQALLQVPFGMWSDKLGRKPIITLGLILFALGSVIAALSHTITGVIIGRCLQGTGAIGSTVIALLADLTSEQVRTKSMAIVGIIIGTAFSLGMVLGPVLNTWIKVSGIFWLTAMLAVCGLVILYYFVPTPEKIIIHPDAETVPANLPSILRNKKLLQLDFSILISHAILTATFVVLPVVLQNNAHLSEAHQWWLYLPVLLLAFISMPPLIILAERKYPNGIFLVCVIGMGIAELLFWLWQHSIVGIALALWLFFTTFTVLEAILPSKVSKTAPAQSKGTAVGVYSTCQFLGIFLGGCLGGWFYGHYNAAMVLLVCATLAVVWILITCCSMSFKN